MATELQWHLDPHLTVVPSVSSPLLSSWERKGQNGRPVFTIAFLGCEMKFGVTYIIVTLAQRPWPIVTLAQSYPGP